MASPGSADGCHVHFKDCALSEWVARVPGLFWTKDAETLRRLAEAAIEVTSEEWIVYSPPGKSQLVSGGIGTLKLLPDEGGNRLVTLSTSHNASCGVPTLISPEVWEHYKLGEGDVLCGQATWRQMLPGWSNRFLSIRGIPRGCLLIEESSQISVVGRNQPMEFHPCTVMEYSSGDALLYDYVYATADTRFGNYRKGLERFFDEYRFRNGRGGNYLLPADHYDPLFDAEFSELDALKKTMSGRSQLHLLEERVRHNSFSGRTLDELAQFMAEYCDNNDLRAICREIHVPRTVLDDVIAYSIANVLFFCVRMN